jgi:hypothetical protein
MNSIRHSAYHRTLRSSAVVVAVLFAFASGAVVPDTRVLTISTERYLANVVGVGASVPQNEFNTLATELAQRSDELEQREREIDARARTQVFANPITMYTLIAILVLQLILIVTNYALDYRRARVAQTVFVSKPS